FFLSGAENFKQITGAWFLRFRMKVVALPSTRSIIFMILFIPAKKWS
ncbi:uncharacterized protein METZ01_LOCUS429496, partial [marine metagenome]